jgi:hypothetical protein
MTQGARGLGVCLPQACNRPGYVLLVFIIPQKALPGQLGPFMG